MASPQDSSRAAPALVGGGGPVASGSGGAAQRGERDLLRRVPPHSVDAEQAVLGGILARPDNLHAIVDILSEEDFYIPAHVTLYRAIIELYKESSPVTLISLRERLIQWGKLDEIGGAAYLGDLGMAVVSGAHAEYYAEIVRNKSLQRRLIDACGEIIGECYSSARPVEDLLETSEQAVFAIAQRRVGRNFSDAKTLVDSCFETMQRLVDVREDCTGVTTGYRMLNQMTGGFQPGNLVIVAARPSVGKTALGICLALNAAVQANTPVAVFSLEMSKEEIIHRMLAAHAKVDMSRLRRPHQLRDEDWARLYDAAEQISRAPIYVDDTGGLSALELRARARRLKSRHGLGLVVVDYLQLMTSGRRIDSREQEVSAVSRSLKALAKEIDAPVVALAQLSRKPEERADHRPLLSDMRESGSIEQDADMIWFIYREAIYANTKPEERPQQDIAEIIIGKQRNGPVGTVRLAYQAPYTAFFDLAPDMPGPSESL